MSIIIQLLFNGLIAGAIYALIASGFSLIYSTNKFIHFAHGATIVFSAYILYFFFTVLGINFWFSAIVAIAFGCFLGYLMNLIVYKQLSKKNASKLTLLIASLGLFIFLESLILLIFGASVKTIGLIRIERGIDFFGAFITPLQINIFFISLLLLFFLFFFMKKTKLGKAMRAVSDNKNVAEIIGISHQKIVAWSFVIGSGLAGVAGILISLEQNLEPIMGTNMMIKGFTAVIVGGIGSVHGAILGAFLLGLVENIGAWFLPTGYKDAISFIILFGFLLFRPQGLLGVKRADDK